MAFKNLTKKILWISLPLFFFSAAVFYFGKKADRYFEAGNEMKTITIGKNKLKAEIASAREEMEKGLSGRDGLCRDCAMLFVFGEEGLYPFWMKDMQFDLDIIWISGNKIVKIAKNVSHAKGASEMVNPFVSADKVLEINAGMSDELEIKIGDELSF